jgi:hypothetical protein
MNMSMLYRLIRLCSAVHHNAETLRLPFLDQQFSQFADEFKASGIFNRGQVEDGWCMVTANDQGMTSKMENAWWLLASCGSRL